MCFLGIIEFCFGNYEQRSRIKIQQLNTPGNIQWWNWQVKTCIRALSESTQVLTSAFLLACFAPNAVRHMSYPWTHHPLILSICHIPIWNIYEWKVTKHLRYWTGSIRTIKNRSLRVPSHPLISHEMSGCAFNSREGASLERFQAGPNMANFGLNGKTVNMMRWLSINYRI